MLTSHSVQQVGMPAYLHKSMPTRCMGPVLLGTPCVSVPVALAQETSFACVLYAGGALTAWVSPGWPLCNLRMMRHVRS